MHPMRGGIDVHVAIMRKQIKMFANQKVMLPKGRHKIIILDEADRYREHSVCACVQ